MWMPRSFGTWSITITTPMPALKPVRTGSEMKFATNPRRRMRAASRIAPVSAASIAVAPAMLASGFAWATSPRAAAERIAMVVVVLTLSVREEPSSA